jgi:hypothetical protein
MERGAEKKWNMRKEGKREETGFRGNFRKWDRGPAGRRGTERTQKEEE